MSGELSIFATSRAKWPNMQMERIIKGVFGPTVVLAASLTWHQATAQANERSLMDWINDMETSGPSAPPSTVAGDAATSELVTLRQLEFATGKYDLTTEHRTYLDSIAGHLLRIPAITVKVQGHTDNVGDDAANQRLSQQRAQSVHTYLVSKGFPAEHIESVGYGETRPLPDAMGNRTKEEQRRNRRVELSIHTDKFVASGDPGSSPPPPQDNWVITTTDGRTIRSSFVVFSADGSEVSYMDPTDGRVMKRLRTVELDRVITPEGKPVRLAEMKQTLEAENTKRIEEEKRKQVRYDGLIIKADAAYEAGRYEEASRLYAEANGLRPKEPHPKARLQAIAGKTAPAPVVDRSGELSFKKGTNVFNFGVGYSGYGYLGSYLGDLDDRSFASPTFCFTYDRGIREIGPDVLGVGFTLGYNWQTYKYSNRYTSYVYNHRERWNNYIFGARANYHFNWWHRIEKLDLYGGVMAGFSIGTYKNTSEYVYNNGQVVSHSSSSIDNGLYYVGHLNRFRYGVYVGCRYYFTKFLGVYAEAGAGVAWVNAGLSLKF